jgi:hypothetical protein
VKVIGEIRFVGDMQRLEVKPGDVYVIQSDQPISSDTVERIRQSVRQVLGAETKVLVIGNGLKFGVVATEPEA